MTLFLLGIWGCVQSVGEDWSGVYVIDAYASSESCVDDAQEQDTPANSLALTITDDQMDIMLCNGSLCDQPWWTGWVESLGPRRVSAWVGQALGSPSLDGVPRCSVAWSEVSIRRAATGAPVTLTGEVWQADGVMLDALADCAEVLDAYASKGEAPCVGAWTFEASRAP